MAGLSAEELVSPTGGTRKLQFLLRSLAPVLSACLLRFLLAHDRLRFRFHLEALLKVYLLQAGDLFSLFADYASAELRLSVGSANRNRLNDLFQLAVKTSSLGSDEVGERLSLIVCRERLTDWVRQLTLGQNSLQAGSQQAGQADGERTLNMINVTYAIPFPLDLVLPPIFLRKLQLCFRRIMRIRVTESELVKAWKVLNELRSLDFVDAADLKAAQTSEQGKDLSGGEILRPVEDSPRSRFDSLLVRRFGFAFALMGAMLSFIQEQLFEVQHGLAKALEQYNTAYAGMDSVDDLLRANDALANSLLAALHLTDPATTDLLDRMYLDCLIYANHVQQHFDMSSVLAGLPTPVLGPTGRQGRQGRQVRTAEDYSLTRVRNQELRRSQLKVFRDSVLRQADANREQIQTLHRRFSAKRGNYESLLE